jgi:putative transcriptional regulator
MESLQGHLLIASPRLPNPFARTVVLLIQHSSEGSLGLVLNRRTEKVVTEIWDQISDQPCEIEHPLDAGGPVPGPLMAIHTDPSLSQLEVLPGVHFSVEREQLEQLVEDRDQPLRLFVGNAGWAPGQLEGELATKAWITTRATVEDVFHWGEDLWEVVRKRLGEAIFAGLKLKDVPEDASLN